MAAGYLIIRCLVDTNVKFYFKFITLLETKNLVNSRKI